MVRPLRKIQTWNVEWPRRQVTFMDKENPDLENSDEKNLEIPPIELLREELAREELKYAFRRTLWNIMVILIVVAAITALVATRLFVLIQIKGISM